MHQIFSPHRFRQQTGNALFLILIAVALFAALAYAVTQSGRGGGNTSAEINRLTIAKIENYAAMLSTAYTRLTVMGCGRTQVSFASSKWVHSAEDYDNATSPPDMRCHVFDPAGAGVEWQHPATGLVSGFDQPLVTGILGVAGIGNGCDGTLLLMTAVTRAICLDVNRESGTVNTGGEPPQWANSSSNIQDLNYYRFGAQGTASFGCGATIGIDMAPNGQELAGKPVGCYESADAGVYIMYVMLGTNL